MSEYKRASGVLLPVSALPEGRIGSFSYKFVDWLKASGQKYWQVLPLNPRDGLGSPYNSKSLSDFDPGYFSGRSQGEFERQWLALKKYANGRGIKIIGDLPFFVPADSVEARSHPQFFLFDRVSGVPADVFSRKGQLWGHPQYNWEEIERGGFKFFIDRFSRALELYDVVRLDHFRGYDAVWSIAKGRKTASKGKWEKVPGEKFFLTTKRALGEMPFIAEDLGVITATVENLRKKFQFLGSRVIQYGKTEEEDVVYYSSTHDSPTLVGAFGIRRAKKLLLDLYQAPAVLAMTYFPDLLGLGNKARFNRPGKKTGNWRWRAKESDFSLEMAERLRKLTVEAGRD